MKISSFVVAALASVVLMVGCSSEEPPSADTDEAKIQEVEEKMGALFQKLGEKLEEEQENKKQADKNNASEEKQKEEDINEEDDKKENKGE